MRSDLKKLIESKTSQDTIKNFQRLVSFLDASLSQAFSLSGDERAKFLVSSILNIRDFLSVEIVDHQTRQNLENAVLQSFDQFVESAELDLESLEVKVLENKKKKEEELKAPLAQEESLSEKDLKTSLEGEKEE